ncbi:MAG: hypothetical protein ABI650_03920, partial [Dokdonella sp.]
MLAGLAENSRQQRQIGLNIRHHHDDVGRFQIRTFNALTQQRIAQHFELTQSCMAGMNAQRAVDARDARVCILADQRWIELTNAFLHTMQARIELRRIRFVLEVANIGQCEFVFERKHEVLAHASPTGQQRMPVLQESGLGGDANGIVFDQIAQRAAIVAQASPVFTARIRDV